MNYQMPVRVGMEALLPPGLDEIIINYVHGHNYSLLNFVAYM